jgi:hypothetical protein
MPGMGILDSLGKVVRGGGRGLSRLGSNRGSLLAIGAIAGTAGLASKVGPAARDATLEVGLGDKDADRYFMGSKLSARSLVGAGMGGPLGTAIQMTSPGDFYKTNPIMPAGVGGQAIAGAGVGGLAGGIGGALLGVKSGGSTFGKVAKGIVGGVMGAGMGATIGGAVPVAGAGIATKAYMNDNADFFGSSPYSGKGTQQIMNDLGASGNIVLGMHNSRKGY